MNINPFEVTKERAKWELSITIISRQTSRLSAPELFQPRLNKAATAPQWEAGHHETTVPVHHIISKVGALIDSALSDSPWTRSNVITVNYCFWALFVFRPHITHCFCCFLPGSQNILEITLPVILFSLVVIFLAFSDSSDHKRHM